MTWAKFGSEFPDDCAEADLSDAAFRTHVEALMYCYRAERADLIVQRRLMGRWATSGNHVDAVRELVDRRFWEPVADGWRILHHGDVFRQSLAYQLNERERARNAMRKKRSAAANADPDVTRNTAPNVTHDVMRTQPVSQSDRQKRQLEANEQADHINPHTGEVSDDPWRLCLACHQPIPDDVWQQGNRTHTTCKEHTR